MTCTDVDLRRAELGITAGYESLRGATIDTGQLVGTRRRCWPATSASPSPTEQGSMDYYQHDLALIHARGYGGYADYCAPDILELLAPVRGGLVLELGCGAGALTRHLLDAGLRVIATDASPAMLELAWAALGGEADLRRLRLPDDPLPAANAVVSVGHVVSYLPDAAAVDRALVAMAGVLRPGGVLAIDICDLEFGQLRAGAENVGRPGLGRHSQDSWPAPDRYVRDITTFVPDGRGVWRRDDERHEYVLVDTAWPPGAARGAWRDRGGGIVVRRGGTATRTGRGHRDEERRPAVGSGKRAHGAGEGFAAVEVVAELAEAGRGRRQQYHAIGPGPLPARRHGGV